MTLRAKDWQKRAVFLPVVLEIMHYYNIFVLSSRYFYLSNLYHARKNGYMHLVSSKPHNAMIQASRQAILLLELAGLHLLPCSSASAIMIPPPSCLLPPIVYSLLLQSSTMQEPTTAQSSSANVYQLFHIFQEEPARRRAADDHRHDVPLMHEFTWCTVK